ncbi:UNVERIFIED_CONTAM: Transmembrane protein 53-A [Sesamum calycinum]|uniref:Transmembrane protein 53-A n=1 Tax=Sesamum calycinum TaxID=2727403 RepID=A0AAW2QY15_9LAMI
MGSLSGILQRPVLAASALAVASVSADCYDKLRPIRSSDTCSSLEQSNPSSSSSSSSSASSHSLDDLNSSWVSRISVSNCPPLPSDVLYRWHLPDPNSVDVSGVSDCSSAKSRTVVVLLGWLGAKQKHLNKYAEWYTSRGFHAITFTFPMSKVLSYQVGGQAEQDIELLVNHLAEWLEEEHGKNLVFHTFSNTGWLTYGVILEKFRQQDSALAGRIRGCIVDSAPVAAPDPQKNSVATKGSVREADAEVTIGTRTSIEVKPALTEAALLLILEKFFGVVLNYPSINRRLSDVLSVLTLEQPSCPQLYIYSSATK